jgi:hypothetical protein
MYTIRRWSVRHARGLEAVYLVFRRVLLASSPLWRAFGLARLEALFAGTERVLKGALFDCQMCGQCILADTGMACPMNCPKSLRNGPCGGVRPDGSCEVDATMTCVWVEAWNGSRRMRNGDILAIQPPIDHRRIGRSAWLADLTDLNRGETRGR